MGQGEGRVELAVGDKETLGFLLHLAIPRQELLLVGMGRKSAHGRDFRFHLDGFAHDLDLFHPVHELPSQGPFGLITGNDDGAFPPPQVMFQVMQDPTGVAHAAGRQDDFRSVRVVDLHRFLDRRRKVNVPHGKEAVSLKFRQGPRFLVVLILRRQGNPRHLRRHGAIDIDWDIRDFAGLLQFLEIVQQDLRTADGKSRDDHVAAPLHRAVHDIRQFLLLVVFLVQAVAVGRFRDDEVGAADFFRILEDRVVRLADVAGENQLGFLPVFRHLHFHNGTAQDMARHQKFHRHARQDVERRVKFVDIEIAQRSVGVVHRKKGAYFGPARPQTFAVGELRVRFLDVGAVRQQDRTQLLRRPRAVDRALVPFLHELRNQAAVVDMGVRQDHGVDVARRKGKGPLVQGFDRLRALEHATIDEEFFPVYFQQVARSGDRPGRP